MFGEIAPRLLLYVHLNLPCQCFADGDFLPPNLDDNRPPGKPLAAADLGRNTNPQPDALRPQFGLLWQRQDYPMVTFAELDKRY